MSDIHADVTVHIDESISPGKRHEVEEGLRKVSGILDVHADGGKPHLMVVKYEPGLLDSKVILNRVKSQGLHAELIGL